MLTKNCNEYLNDDGSSVPKEEGLLPGIGYYKKSLPILITDQPV